MNVIRIPAECYRPRGSGAATIARNLGIVEFFVREQADSVACLEIVRQTAPAWLAWVSTDEYDGYDATEDELQVCHGSVKH